MKKIILRDLVNIVHNSAIGFIEYVNAEAKRKDIFDWTDEPGFIGDDEDYLEGLSQYIEKYGDKEVVSIEASGFYDTVHYLKIEIR